MSNTFKPIKDIIYPNKTVPSITNPISPPNADRTIIITITNNTQFILTAEKSYIKGGGIQGTQPQTIEPYTQSQFALASGTDDEHKSLYGAVSYQIDSINVMKCPGMIDFQLYGPLNVALTFANHIKGSNKASLYFIFNPFLVAQLENLLSDNRRKPDQILNIRNLGNNSSFPWKGTLASNGKEATLYFKMEVSFVSNGSNDTNMDMNWTITQVVTPQTQS